MFRRRQTVTLADAIETFLADLAIAGRAEGTLELYHYLLNGLVTALGHERRLISVRREDIVGFLAHVKERGTSQSYLNLTAHVTKSFLGWTVRQAYIARNPMDGMVLPKEHPQPRRPFTNEELHRLMAAATTPLAHAIVLLLLDMGLRASELTSLLLADVDLEGGTVVVHGKGAKVRVVALNEEPRQALLAYLKSRPQHDGIIWPQGFNRKKLAYILDGIGRRAHVAPVFAHRFRHTFASYFLRETGDPLALKALLGHSSLTMVTRYVGVLEGERAVEVHRAHSLV